jgi:glycosyltransferase involved in cell wall biosynthesis
MGESKKKLVSLVVPCYNEAQGLDEFLNVARAVAVDLAQYDWEFLFVDDGSTDDSELLLSRQALADSRVKSLFLSRNFGQQRAISAGLDFCTGDFVVILDADLQDPPELLPPMLDALERGADVAHAVRCERSSDSFTKRISAQAFYAIMRRWVLPDLVPNAGEFKAFNRAVLEALRQYPERVRFLRGLFATVGFRQVQIPFSRPPRRSGHSGFPPRAVLRLARDAIVSNTALPLRLGFYLGCLLLMLAALCAGACLLPQVRSAFENASSMLFLSLNLAGFGVTFMLLGGIGEYLKCIVLEVKQRPRYFVRKTLNL